MAVYKLNNVEFLNEDGDGIWVSAPPPPTPLRHEHIIPYSGGEVVVDRGGFTQPPWTFTMLVTPANKAAMVANLDVVPIPLVTPDETFANCELISLGDAKVLKDRGLWSFSAAIVVAP